MQRRFVQILMVSALIGSLSAVRAEEPSTKSVGTAMAAGADRFLDALDASQRKMATRAFDDPSRLDWHNIPKPERKGLQLREMTAAQREHCHALLQVALSEEGYSKAVRILSLESNLREGEKNRPGSPLRDPERYFLTIFGTPADSGTWGWSFEGHHFSLNFVISDGEVVSRTPSFWGANPATVGVFVDGGPKVGVRTLAIEEQLAFDLVGSLNEEQKAKAVIADKAPDDYRNAGVPAPPSLAHDGLSASAMTDEQQETLLSLLTVYCSHLADPLAKQQLAEIQENGWGDVYFAWAGSTTPGVGHYYRVQGPSFVLELVNIQADPQGNPANHIHSVWRDPRGDFGLSAR